MIQHGGVYLPDGEQHMVEWMTRRNEQVDGKLTYQYHKQRRALDLTKGRGLMVDVGAHCGLWTMWMAREFDTILAFEPVHEHVDCLMHNCAGMNNVQIHQFALGEQDGRTAMYVNPESSGDAYPRPGVREGETIVRRFDGLNVTARVDLVKVDCEGYELFVLKGMREMLERDHPTVVVEQKRNMAGKFGLEPGEAVRFLEAMGATLALEMAGDFFLRWE